MRRELHAGCIGELLHGHQACTALRQGPGATGAKLNGPEANTNGKGREHTALPLLSCNVATLQKNKTSAKDQQNCRGSLVLLFANLFAITLASQSFFDAALFAWLEIEGVALNFLDDVLGLYLALEAAQGILKGLTLLNTNLCQWKTPPNLPEWPSTRIAPSAVFGTFFFDKRVTWQPVTEV